ncbi:DUF4835 family protein [bacterium]|nr:DUF4835 family protein [bacterium]
MVRRYNHILIKAIAVVVLAGVSGQVPAQTVKCEVVLHTEGLPLDEQRYLEGLEEDIRIAIETYRWTNDFTNTELPLHVEIFFEKYSLYGAYHKYGAGIMVALKDIQMRDRRWDFRLNRTDRLRFGNRYDSFTGLIEFYLQICLGFENDRFSALGGRQFYEKARNIADKARFEAKYNQGWDQRRELIDDLMLKDSYINMRSAAFYVNAGYYYLGKNNLEKTLAYLAKGIELTVKSKPELLELRREGHIIRFIDIERLAAALKEIEAYDLLDSLADWDQDRMEIYR